MPLPQIIESVDEVRMAFDEPARPRPVRIYICPGDGGMSSAASLRAVTRPVEIRWADADVIAPPEQTALRLLESIAGARGRSLGRDVEHHYLFPDDADGAAVRRQAGADAVAFFARAAGLDTGS